MEKKLGIIYSSVDGQTRKISQALLQQLHRQQIAVKLYSIEDFEEEVTDFDLLVIGAGIRYGKHNLKVRQFVLNNKESLSRISTAFFSVNLVARKSDKNSPETNPYLIKFLKDVNWNPDMLAVFAGKLDYRAYSLLDRIMIKLIMKLTQGPTRTDTTIEYTDWKRVRDFGELVFRELYRDSSRK
ncbi:menaquinone-dependent protoporphyrinogen IX dehydrogenase [Salegentibacter flavus]|uniref:Protoporphyrinogen IX dehydrogenase [quinone] n=1 Tax=Salegentibacter flavus TaxID=287099 RepID=A0A1I5B4H4_9FLAO|nr:menaquinone-dependent protoporphyrinogen IX dehydrogenase [Salegentibacter flavus]SFN69594.1 menaquinone-dependent protoporphyrinogen oxidase [Salegentibacter flavus]